MDAVGSGLRGCQGEVREGCGCGGEGARLGDCYFDCLGHVDVGIIKIIIQVRLQGLHTNHVEHNLDNAHPFLFGWIAYAVKNANANASSNEER